MLVKEVMTSPAITVGSSATLREIALLMLEHEVSALPVVDGGVLFGIVTEADLLAREAFGARRRHAAEFVAEYFVGVDPRWLRKASGLTAGAIMTRAVVAATPDDRVEEAARRMLVNGVKRLVVVEAGEVVGVVTRADLLRYFVPENAPRAAATASATDRSVPSR